jgi:uncharacterized caspase-like protein
MDVVEGLSTSPYTTPLVQKSRQRKNLVEAIGDAHQQVLEVSKGAQRPLLSTSMNGQIYLHQQPPGRRKRVVAVSVDDPGAGISKLQGPSHDVDAMVAALTESGFSQSEVMILRNPKKAEIEEAILTVAQAFRRKSSAGAKGRLTGMTPGLFIRTGLIPVEEATPPGNTLLLFFFSGHGVGVANENYIIPRLSLSSASLNGPEDIENSAVSVTLLTRFLERSAAASVLILDTHFPTVSFTPTR